MTPGVAQQLPELWPVGIVDAPELVQDLAAEPVDVPADVFARARARIKNQKHRLVTIARSASGAEGADALGSGTIAAALRSCADGLDGTLAPDAGGRRGRNFNLAALETWADRLAGDRSADGWARVFPRGHRLWRGLSSINEYVDRAGTGGGLMRTMYARGLAELAAAGGRAALKNAAVRYEELGAAWTELARAALPADVPVLRETADLIAWREQVVRDGGPAVADEARQLWRRLAEIEQEMHDDFPLSQDDVDALLADLQSRVRAIEASERSAVLTLREIAGSVEGGTR